VVAGDNELMGYCMNNQNKEIMNSKKEWQWAIKLPEYTLVPMQAL
jgi:hypothetical protein